MLYPECNSSVCFYVNDSLITNSGELNIQVMTNNISPSSQIMTVLPDGTDQILGSLTVLSHETDSHFNMSKYESVNFSSLIENVTASPFQRPSDINENVDIDVLNVPNVSESYTSFSQVTQHSHNDNSDSLLQCPITISSGNLSSAVHESQEVTGSQV